MKRITRFLAVLIPLLAVSISVFARTQVPIVDYNDIAIVTASGKPITADQVRSAITAAATSRKWELSKSPTQNLLSATLHVRGKHTVVVSIPYSVEKFSLKYENSVNMDYRPADSSNAGQTNDKSMGGAPLIHPFYNKWVQDLMLSIKNELNKI